VTKKELESKLNWMTIDRDYYEKKHSESHDKVIAIRDIVNKLKGIAALITIVFATVALCIYVPPFFEVFVFVGGGLVMLGLGIYAFEKLH